MNQQSQLSPLGRALIDSLQRIDTYETAATARREKDTIHVQTVGSTVSTAYEQLRNASEYAEDELLQQRAIRRYLKRVLSFHVKVSTTHLADELVTELTQAEYLSNDYATKTDIRAIAKHINHAYDAYWKFAEEEARPSKRQAFQQYMLDILAVQCEQVLQSHMRQLMFAHFAFTYLHDKLTLKKLLRDHEKISTDDFSFVLYTAIHRAILKSDSMTIRAALCSSYQIDSTNVEKFYDFNQKLDDIFEANTTAYTTRIVGRNGAVLRFIYTGFFRDDAAVDIKTLTSPETLEYALRTHIESEYIALDKRLDKGILRSIVFLLITKSIVGIAIEVPYDLFVHGAIVWLPLAINLLFPSVFIALTRLTLTIPNVRNTNALINQITGMLFTDDRYKTYPVRLPKESSSVGFNVAYAAMFLLMFAGLSYILYLLQFNIVQGVIFFIFLSTASFLAFRLSRQIHEIEVVHASQGTVSLLRDVIYMPFIYVGQRISYRYAQINIVANILDILIELPLKTILRLIRQWTSFLNAKKDELI